MTVTHSSREQATSLRAAIGALVRRFSLSERADVSCCGLTVAQAATLEALRDPEPARLGTLARRLGITPSTLTRNLVRLEADGLVARRTDAEDARAARLHLTKAGERASERVARQELVFAEGILERLGAERRKEVIDALFDLLAAVREATDECCPGAFDHLMKETARPCPGETERRSDGNECCRK